MVNESNPRPPSISDELEQAIEDVLQRRADSGDSRVDASEVLDSLAETYFNILGNFFNAGKESRELPPQMVMLGAQMRMANISALAALKKHVDSEGV